jgi:DNA-binding IclR family transcriptional regulator
MNNLEEGSVAGAQLVSYAARVLRAVAAQHAGLRIADIARHTGLERSTVNRVVRALCAERLLMAGPQPRHYVLGPLAFELGLAAARNFPLREIAASSLERLAELTGDTCFLMVRSGADAVCLDRREGAYPVRALSIGIGDRRQLGAAAGSLAMLLAMPEDEREAYVRDNAERIRAYGMLDADVVRAMIRRAQELGFALNQDNIIPDVAAVGVAIPSRVGVPFAALSVSALTSRMIPGDRYRTVVQWLRREAEAIAAKL